MTRAIFTAGLATAAILLAAAPSFGADLGGSIKDDFIGRPTLGQSSPTCYFKAATGYSFAQNPGVQWQGTSFNNVHAGDVGLGEVAVGCGQGGDRGFRGELALGYHGRRSLNAAITSVPPGVTAYAAGDTARTSVQSAIAMVNVYYDIGNWRGFVPYVGAGGGFAYNRLGNSTTVGQANPNELYGADNLTAAWALMAGAEYKFTERTSIDVGYRYINFGSAHSDHGDTGQSYNPRFNVTDNAAHEILVGLRYKFCGSCSH